MCKCWAQWLLIAIIFVFSIMTLFTVSGCGVKGSLYLPDDDKAKHEKPQKQSEDKIKESARE